MVNTFLEPSLHERVEEIIQEFPWDKVHQYMEHTNWTWWYGDSRQVPTVEKLIQEGKERLLHVILIGEGYVSCGGLKASVSLNKKELTLEFVIAECYA